MYIIHGLVSVICVYLPDLVHVHATKFELVQIPETRILLSAVCCQCDLVVCTVWPYIVIFNFCFLNPVIVEGNAHRLKNVPTAVLFIPLPYCSGLKRKVCARMMSWYTGDDRLGMWPQVLCQVLGRLSHLQDHWWGHGADHFLRRFWLWYPSRRHHRHVSLQAHTN